MRPTLKTACVLTLLGAFTLDACKRTAHVETSGVRADEAPATPAETDAAAPDSVEIAVVTQFSPHARALFDSIASASPLHDYNLSRGAQDIGAIASDEVTFSRASSGDPEGITHEIQSETYKGVLIGSRVIVFKQDFGAGVAERHWQPFRWFAASWLGGDVRDAAALATRVRAYLDAKIYEPMRLDEVNAAINTVDFIAHFIPGYAGAERVFVTGDGGVDTFIGVAEIVGDVATLGLGSKVRVVKQGAAALVLTAASVRIGNAAAKAINGQATLGTGLDAFLATVEAGMASVTLIKLKLTPVRALLNNADEAAVVGRALGKDPQVLLREGLDLDDLRRLGVELGKHGDEAVAAGRAWLQSLTQCISGAAEGAALTGFALDTAANDVCQTLAVYGKSLERNGFEYGWIRGELMDGLRGDAGPAATKKFLAALKKGMAEGSSGATGIKTLDLTRPHPSLPAGYTHELKIGGSAARLLGRIEDVTVAGRARTVLVFDRFVPAGLH